MRHNVTDKERLYYQYQEILDIFNNVALGVSILLGTAISLLMGVGHSFSNRAHP